MHKYMITILAALKEANDDKGKLVQLPYILLCR